MKLMIAKIPFFVLSNSYLVRRYLVWRRNLGSLSDFLFYFSRWCSSLWRVWSQESSWGTSWDKKDSCGDDYFCQFLVEWLECWTWDRGIVDFSITYINLKFGCGTWFSVCLCVTFRIASCCWISFQFLSSPTAVTNPHAHRCMNVCNLFYGLIPGSSFADR